MEINGIDTMNNAKHIIVTGYSRSGTTMLYHMLRGSVANYEFMDEEIPAERVVGIDHKNRITKRPLDLFNLEQIHQKNIHKKALSLIILIRDIRSIITSFHEAVPDDYFIGYDHQYFVNRATGETKYCNPGIMQIHQAIVQALRNLHFARKIIIKYEDILKFPGQQQEYIGRELGLEYIDRFENFHKKPLPKHLVWHLNKVRALDESRIDGWKSPEHAQRIRSQFTRCPELFDLLIQYGYEKDRNWFEQYIKPNSPDSDAAG